MKNQHKPSGFSRFCFRFLRFFVRLIYPKTTLHGLENLPQEPCILVGNHSQLHGPIMGELYLPFDRGIWTAAQMMTLKEVPAYTFQDFWSIKPRWTHWFYRIISYLIAPLSACIFNNAHTIAVRRDNRIINTFRETVNTLDRGAHVVIFPECYTPYNNIVHQFQENFVTVAKLYHKRTGKAIKFVPLYIAPNLHAMYIGTPISYDPNADQDAERSRICLKLMDGITDIAAALPPHKVVPYPNLPKKMHPMNVPIQKESL